MKEPKNNRVWQLVIGKVNSSLSLEEEEEFEKIKDTEEVKKALTLANQIHKKAANGFIIKNIEKEKNWRKINNQISPILVLRRQLFQLSKYAAVFAFALLVGIMLPKIFNYFSSEISYNSIELEWGQMGKMTLADSTKVWLNAGTTFKYPSTFNSKSRAVELNGEAQFQVTHNDKIPFEVKTESGVIKVYGTTFNVKSYEDDDELVVSLIEGKVTVENSKGKYLATLKPSEQISINKKTGKANIRIIDTEYYSNWINGKILLKDTRLDDLAEILKRWYNVDIKLVGENIGDLKISGTIIKGKPIDLFLKILERMYGIRYELIANNNKRDEVTIYKN